MNLWSTRHECSTLRSSPWSSAPFYPSWNPPRCTWSPSSLYLRIYSSTIYGTPAPPAPPPHQTSQLLYREAAGRRWIHGTRSLCTLPSRTRPPGLYGGRRTAARYRSRCGVLVWSRRWCSWSTSPTCGCRVWFARLELMMIFAGCIRWWRMMGSSFLYRLSCSRCLFCNELGRSREFPVDSSLPLLLLNLQSFINLHALFS